MAFRIQADGLEADLVLVIVATDLGGEIARARYSIWSLRFSSRFVREDGALASVDLPQLQHRIDVVATTEDARRSDDNDSLSEDTQVLNFSASTHSGNIPEMGIFLISSPHHS